MTARRLSGIALLLLAALGFSLRLAPLGRYVTPDEPAWVERSIRFADALAAQDWGSVPSTGHPGVTTMWLGAAGVTARRWMNPAESAGHLDWIRHLVWLAPENAEAFRHLAFFLPGGRIAVALIVSLTSIAGYVPLKRLFGRQVALLAVGLRSFEPFLVGHGGLLHTDGLLTAFSMLSLLCLLVTVRDGERAAGWAAASGLTGGLALLTKSLAGYLVIFGGIVFGWAWLSGRLRLSQAIGRAAVWGISAFVIYVGLYPAMWGQPVKTVQDLLAAPAYQSTTALMPVFFAGRTALHHGPEFYLAALPFRLSPVVLIGAMASVWTFARAKDLRSDLAWLGVFCLGYLLLLALNVKRYQRYLLLTFGPLTVMAAIGLSEWWQSHRWGRRLGVRSLVLVQLCLLLPFAAYPLTSFNLLLGGPWVGARLLSADWGEGMGAAANWLNGRPDARQLTVAASSVPPFASVFEGHTVSLDETTMADYVVRGVVQGEEPSLERPVAHTVTAGFLDHAVVLTNTAPLEQAGYLSDHAASEDLILVDFDSPLLRQYEGPGDLHSTIRLPDEAAVAGWLERRMADRAHATNASIWHVSWPEGSPITASQVSEQLERIATIKGSTTVAGVTVTEYVSVASPPDTGLAPYRAAFGGQLILVDGAFPSRIAPSKDLGVVLRWRAAVKPSVDYRAVMALRDDEGHTWSRAEMPVINSVFFPTSAWESREWSDAPYEMHIPSTIPPGSYRVEVSLYRGDTGARLGATGPGGDFRGTRVPVGGVTVTRPTPATETPRLDVPQRMDKSVGPLTLLGAEPPAGRTLSGDHLSFALVWQAEETLQSDYEIRLQLIDSDSQVELETTRPLSPYPTSNWRAGDRFESRYRVHVFPEVPAGSYDLWLSVVDPEDGVVGTGRIPLATVNVLLRDRSFTVPEGVSRRLDLVFGDAIHLWGYDIKKREIAPGETLSLTLYWRADGTTVRPEESLTLFVHLLGPDGLTYSQVDRIPGEGNMPTHSWAPGQVIVDDVELPVDASAPPGAYQIAVGFYDPWYGDRLPVTDASGEHMAVDRATLPVEITVSGSAR